MPEALKHFAIAAEHGDALAEPLARADGTGGLSPAAHLGILGSLGERCAFVSEKRCDTFWRRAGEDSFSPYVAWQDKTERLAGSRHEPPMRDDGRTFPKDQSAQETP